MPDGNGQGKAITAQVMISEGDYLDQLRANATTYVRRHAVDDLHEPESLTPDVIMDRIDVCLEILGLDELTLTGEREDIHAQEVLAIRRRAEARRNLVKRHAED